MFGENFARIVNFVARRIILFSLSFFSFTTRRDDDARCGISITKACVISERAETNGYPCTCCTASYTKRKWNCRRARIVPRRCLKNWSFVCVRDEYVIVVLVEESQGAAEWTRIYSDLCVQVVPKVRKDGNNEDLCLDRKFFCGLIILYILWLELIMPCAWFSHIRFS